VARRQPARFRFGVRSSRGSVERRQPTGFVQSITVVSDACRSSHIRGRGLGERWFTSTPPNEVSMVLAPGAETDRLQGLEGLTTVDAGLCDRRGYSISELKLL
jgi:hypothetical protein